MPSTRAITVMLAVLASCASCRREPDAEAPWSHAYSGAPDGWWVEWHSALGGKVPFGAGTQFEIETLGPHGNRQTEVIEVVSIRATAIGSFELRLQSSATGSPYRASMPPDLAYTRGSPGSLTTRNERLVPVTVPAGTFSAGRLWRSETVGDVSYEQDEWVVPDLPIRVQTWSRPVSATELYNPPADGSIPEGTTLTRLIRITRK